MNYIKFVIEQVLKFLHFSALSNYGMWVHLLLFIYTQ